MRELFMLTARAVSKRVPHPPSTQAVRARAIMWTTLSVLVTLTKTTLTGLITDAQTMQAASTALPLAPTKIAVWRTLPHGLGAHVLNFLPFTLIAQRVVTSSSLKFETQSVSRTQPLATSAQVARWLPLTEVVQGALRTPSLVIATQQVSRTLPPVPVVRPVSGTPSRTPTTQARRSHGLERTTLSALITPRLPCGASPIVPPPLLFRSVVRSAPSHRALE
mmetsp:Transcript_112/g.372  ORF Transcript_112/g.372 Transcript_112/m.372 type:complete len:221 (-) Transcript_112:582-1244(-)